MLVNKCDGNENWYNAKIYKFEPQDDEGFLIFSVQYYLKKVIRWSVWMWSGIVYEK